MIVTVKTPFRISFFGGGTDYPDWYNENPGAVLSTTIDKYCIINARTFESFFSYNYRLTYSIIEEASKISDIKHPCVREALKYLKFEHNFAMNYDADLPARSGLGTSSSFTVGLLNAIHGLKGEMTSKRQLATEAIHLEQNLIKENVGSQDQTAAAFGGFNKIEFGGPNIISVSPVVISPARLKLLESRLMLFFTNFSRNASEIAGEQIENIKRNQSELRAMLQILDYGIEILKGGSDINEFGRLLNETWKIKRSLASNVSTDSIDSIYNAGIRAGAIGGKLLGAGGGGFMLFFVEPELQAKIKAGLPNLLHVPFNFEYLGSHVVYIQRP